jgi:hypothetical protein
MVNSASKPLWALGLLSFADVCCDFELLFLVIFLKMLDVQLVASDECGSLVMMNSESVEKDLNDIKWAFNIEIKAK